MNAGVLIELIQRSLDYLINSILTKTPPPPSHVPNWRPTERKALGYSAGFIRDRTRAIRKEFAMQSSWGHDESIGTFERIARWHILCLRELQEESGMNKDMHIDSAELGRCQFLFLSVQSISSPPTDINLIRLYKSATTL